MSQKPRESDLASRGIVLFADHFQTIGKFENVWEILMRISNLSGELGTRSAPECGDRPIDCTPEVILVKIVWGFILTSDEPSAQRRVRYDGDPELPCSFEEIDFLVLDIESECGIFALNGGDGVHGVRPTQGRRRAFRQTKILDFTSPASYLVRLMDALHFVTLT